MKKQKVKIQKYTTVTGPTGIKTKVWTDADTIECVIIPTGNEYALRQFGYTNNVKYLLVFRGNNALLKEGNRIIYEGKNLDISYVANYNPTKRAVSVLLNTEG